MSAILPIPRDFRERELTLAQNQVLLGPFNFIVFDPADVTLELKTPTDADYVPQTIFSVAPAAPATNWPAHFTIGLTGPRPPGTLARVRGRRLHERLLDVTQGGAIRSVPLEHELDRQSVVLQELRRDVGTNMADDFAATLAACQAYALAAQAAADSVANKTKVVGDRHNLIDNPSFQIYQRGNVFTNPAYPTKGPDRWWIGQAGVSPNVTYRIVGNEGTISGTGRALQMHRAPGSGSGGQVYLAQAIPISSTLRVVNSMMTVKIWLQAGANFSAAGGTVNVQIFAGVPSGDDLPLSDIGNWPGVAVIDNRNLVVTGNVTASSWQVNVPAGYRELGIFITWVPTGVAGNDDLLNVWGLTVWPGVEPPEFCVVPPWTDDFATCASFWENLANPSLPGLPPGPNVVAFPLVLPMVDGIQYTVALVRFMPKRRKNYTLEVSTNPLAAHLADPNGGPIYDLTIDESNGVHHGWTEAYLMVKYTIGTYNGRSHLQLDRPLRSAGTGPSLSGAGSGGVAAILATDNYPDALLAFNAGDI